MVAARTPLPVTRALASLGAHLSHWRRLNHLTVEEVADRAGVSSRTVLRLEGGSGATLENTLRVARALGVLDQVVSALDPYSTDVGRARADQQLPQRVRHPRPRDDA